MKNHLFIGLGGQGGKSIAELQKVFAARGKDESFLRAGGCRWDFLYIDSSRDVTNERRNWVYFGRDLKLKPSSFLYLKDDGESINALAMAQKPDVAPWIGDVNRLQAFLEGVQGIQGANQRRRLGRLLFARNADRIHKAICEDKITPMLTSSNQCAVHIFASLAGGTGSGGIVDLVTMIRTQFPNADANGGFPIFLYLYVTDLEFEDAQVGYFHQNQSAALRDLNALCCGRFKPTLLGNARGAVPFSADEPVTQILLSSQLSSKNQMLPLSVQHQTVAEAAFERIHSYVSGHLDTTQQKSVTGEDKLASFAGEPRGNVLRTFRFGSVGMRRWEVPIGEVRELLARDLFVSSCRRLLYQNWNDSLGAMGVKLSSGIPGYAETMAELDGIINAGRISNAELPGLMEKLNSDFSQFHAGKRKDGFRDSDLEDYEQELQRRYSTALDARGVDAVFRDVILSRSQRLERIRHDVHDAIRRAWTRRDRALGLAYVHDLLTQLQEKTRQDAANDGAFIPDHETLRLRIAKRRAEWRKLTVLSRLVKQDPLALAHQQDLLSILRDDLRSRSKAEDREILNAVAKLLGELASHYQSAARELQKWCGDAEKRRDDLHGDLKSMLRDHGQPASSNNKVELSLENLEAHLKDQRLEATFIGNACDELLEKALLDTLGNDLITRLGYLPDERKTQLREAADAILFRRIDQIDEAVRERTHRDSVLTGSVLDILSRRRGEDPDKFSGELLTFINSATCNIALARGEMQPKAFWQDQGMPSMPRTALIIGLPKGHSFGTDLAGMIKPHLDAGNNAVQGVYYHDDPTQIRMLFVTYWMAARFATVVHRLEAMYLEALSRDRSGDVAYFTNIDSSGERGQRPAMVLPQPEELQSTMRAMLWLGTRVPEPSSGEVLIQESDGQVFLIQREDDGVVAVPLGESVTGLSSAADVITIHRVNDAVTSAVAALDADRLRGLRGELEIENKLRLQQSVTSPSYKAWEKERKQINALLKS